MPVSTHYGESNVGSTNRSCLYRRVCIYNKLINIYISIYLCIKYNIVYTQLRRYMNHYNAVVVPHTKRSIIIIARIIPPVARPPPPPPPPADVRSLDDSKNDKTYEFYRAFTRAFIFIFFFTPTIRIIFRRNNNKTKKKK